MKLYLAGTPGTIERDILEKDYQEKITEFLGH